MSDHISFETIEAAKARDSRLQDVARAVAVEADLTHSPAIRAIMAAIRADADAAMEQLTEISPLDAQKIANVLVNVRTLVYIRRTLDSILRRGAAAEQDIRAEDAAHSE